MRVLKVAATLVLAAGLAGCGGTSQIVRSVRVSQLEGSIRAVLIHTYRAPQPVTVQCGSGTVHAGQVLNCDAVSSAGQGYLVRARLPCWTATFNGKIIEGPGLLPPSQRPAGPIATGPDNLPNTFSGCVK